MPNMTPQLHPKKIAITGGPGTGKTSIINLLIERDFICFEEISRQITLQARKDGIEQLFLTDPLLFSKKLLQGRIKQYNDASEQDTSVVFLDRGIPDVLAYMDFIGDDYPDEFEDACKTHIYDTVFILPPWEAIFTSDSERYEDFNQAKTIHHHLVNTYTRFGYDLLDVPFGTIEERVNFIQETLEL